MYSLSVNQNYKEEKKREREALKQVKMINKSIEKSKLSSLKQIQKQSEKRVYATKPSKSKQLSDSHRQSNVKRLDIQFSIFIRLLYAESVTGWCRCITCNDKIHWKEIQNGHFINRANYKYRRDEKNCHPQCKECNEYKNGNLKEYKAAMIHKY
jgi:hypothetical protein